LSCDRLNAQIEIVLNNYNLPVVLQPLLEIYLDHPEPWCAARRRVPAHTGVCHSHPAPSPSLGEPFSAQPDKIGLSFTSCTFS